MSSADSIRLHAQRLFAAQGYGATSITQIARASGVSKAAVFHHYPSKRNLYLAVIESAHRDLAGELEDLSVGADAYGRLRTLMAVHLEYLVRNADVTRLVVRELLNSDLGADERSVLGAALNRNYQRVAAALEGVQTGVSVNRVKDAAFLTLAANLAYVLLGPCLDELEGSPGADRVTFVQRMSRALYSGVAPKDAT